MQKMYFGFKKWIKVLETSKCYYSMVGLKEKGLSWVIYEL